MRGEAVVVRMFEESGKDALNNPILAPNDIQVENVLVAPGSSGDINESTRPFGVEVKYTLYFPKTFDSKIENSQVLVRGEWLHVVGSPRHYDANNCPTKWWMVAEVGATNG